MPIIHPVTGQEIKLGRTYARRTFQSFQKHLAMSKFLSVLPDDFAPTVFDNSNGIDSWGMMENDTLGDCTIAAPGHLVQAWTAAEGSEYTIPDSDIQAAYSAFCGYIPGNPATDQGGDMLTVQSDWQTKGIGGKFISAFGEVNMSQMRWQQATCVFGGINVGVQLPQGFESEIGGTFADLTNPPDPTQGHDMACVGYNSLGPVFVTWGALQQATWAWAMRYADECLACLSPDWKKSPLPLAELTEAMQQIAA